MIFMKLKIAKIEKATSHDWDIIWKNCEYATFFHSRYWAEIWSKYSNLQSEPCPYFIHFSDGKKLLLPFSKSTAVKGLLKFYVTSPAGTYGGWISNDKLEHNHIMVLCDYIFKEFSNLEWRLNPFDLSDFNIRYKKIIEDETDIIRLTDSIENIFKNWSTNHRRSVKKALHNDIEIREAQNEEEWLQYYNCYMDSVKRWGENRSSFYSWKLFEIIHSAKSECIKLWVAIFNSEIISGSLCFYSKNHAVYWNGATKTEYFHIRPVHLLMYKIIEDAINKNFKWFDFNPSGGHEGVKKFKKSFNTESISCPIIYSESLLSKILFKFQKFVL